MKGILMCRIVLFLLACVPLGVAKRVEAADQPNILFLFSDDHAVKAISAYGGPLADVAPTPNIDRLAREGVVFLNSFCANSICGPSRAPILTGKHNHKDIVRWNYRRYLRNYLSTVKAVDESVGRLLKYLDDNGLAENTVVIYSSDQGFYLGEHGWYDTRWMFEESFRTPFLLRWAGVAKPGSNPSELIQNIDYAPTFLDTAGLDTPAEIQGRSLVPLLDGSGKDWRKSLYYAYYELGEHAVPQHFGVRTQTYKLIYFPQTDEWNLFDLERDPDEMRSVHAKPEYQQAREELAAEFARLRRYFDAPPFPPRQD